MIKLIKLILVLIGCQTMFGQSLPIPVNYAIIDSVQGDLNRDGIDELVAAYDTKASSEEDSESVSRELVIYQKVNGNWITWKKSAQALLGSRDGGMMGDPFGAIEIVNGILLVSQNGGSSWKWGYTDKYRFQDDAFYLIGYSSSFGKPCEYWTDVEFNLSTGKLIINKEYESCENDTEGKIYKSEKETVYKKGLKLTFEKRNEKEIKIVTPKYQHILYLASNNGTAK